MNHRKKIGILLLSSLFGVLVGYLTIYPEILGHKYVFSVGDPLFLTSLSLSIIFLILLFTKEAVFNSWKKFGIWYIPLAAVLIFLAPSSSGGSFGYSMGFDREAVSMFTSALFLIISLLIIAIKSWRLRGK